MAPPRAPYIVPALKKHTATVIMAHGLGDSGAGWMSLAQNWRRRGMFDELDYESAIRHQDEPGVLRSRDYFNTLIKEQIDKGIKPSRIVLGGFSQGAAISVFTGITCKEKLGGVFGLSSYLVLSDKLKNYIPENWPNKKTPFFLAHGLEDEIVLFDFGDLSAKKMKEIGLEDVTFKSYPNLGHSADPVEIEDLARFLQKVIPPEDDGQASAGL
ncbi:hypothetical protein KXV97_009532 [Aspergillus fumigatus]|nr:hypothetical protein KXV97_009532 [Aspergillus fumigatus]